MTLKAAHIPSAASHDALERTPRGKAEQMWPGDKLGVGASRPGPGRPGALGHLAFAP